MSEAVEFPTPPSKSLADELIEASVEIKTFASEVLDADILEAFEEGNIPREFLVSVQTLRLLKKMVKE